MVGLVKAPGEVLTQDRIEACSRKGIVSTAIIVRKEELDARLVEWADPYTIYAQGLDVVELAEDSRQIAHAVARGVVEARRVDLWARLAVSFRSSPIHSPECACLVDAHLLPPLIGWWR